jgi:hypothetical protein
LETAILSAVSYADVFDYPLTLAEVHRYLAGEAASYDAVREALENGLIPSRRLICVQGYVALPEREAIVELRLHREAASARLWRKATRYAGAIASLPFVRMVAVTGTLAVNNAERGHDIDYLIVTAPGRVWLTRLFVVAFVHLGHLERLTLCPNYVFSSDALAQFEPSFFVAHELAQMVPLYGLDTYHELLRANAWVSRYLPNAFLAARELSPRVAPVSWILKRGAERALEGKAGSAWEARVQAAKLAQFQAEAAACPFSAASFTVDCCKGHIEDHSRQIDRAYRQRLRQVGLDGELGASQGQEPG